VANGKGGVGKTTTSVFLAHALGEATGAPCAIVDVDPQASATQWARLAAEAGQPLRVPVLTAPGSRLAAVVQDATHVVIDTPPAEPETVAAAIDLADLVLVPTSASALDLSRVQVTVDAATCRGKPAVVLLTRTRRTRSVGAAEESLRKAGVRLLRTHIPLREALAMAFGRPVGQLHGYDLATAELLGALPAQPYSVEAVRQRLDRPWTAYRKPVLAHPRRRAADHPASQAATPAAVRVGPIGLGDDELIQRLKSSMARLAAQR
jgi:chromosome partitioning protein